MKALAIPVTVLLVAAAPVPSSPGLGKAEGRCRTGETGPALLVDVFGLKDRQGTLKLEVYPATDQDFLQDDNILINAGKVFRRVEMPVPATGSVSLCIRVPQAGSYAVSLLHDRDASRRFGWTVDGIGFSGNPKLGWSKPKAGAAQISASAGLTRIAIRLNYRSGFGVAPLKTASQP